MAAAQNLAGILGSTGKLEEAILLRETVLAYLNARFPPDDKRVMALRDGLGILYERAGAEDKRNELYRNSGICADLKPAEKYLRERGAHVVAVTRPWSANCHVWIYFDVVLDCEGLIKDLGLPPHVQIHDHRGTHDGSERGIVCTVHHDGIMGRCQTPSFGV
jgi:hypothetical protein